MKLFERLTVIGVIGGAALALGFTVFGIIFGGAILAPFTLFVALWLWISMGVIVHRISAIEEYLINDHLRRSVQSAQITDLTE